MSIEVGMAITVISVVLMVVFFAVYLWLDYTGREYHREFIRRNALKKRRELAVTEKEIKNTIWEACEFTVNNINRKVS